MLAINDQFDGSGNGGLLSISFGEAPSPLTADITVNRYGQVDTRTGIATISGTYTCVDADFIADFIEVFVYARQSVGRFTVNGFGSFFNSGMCDGAPHAWSAEVLPQNGKFAGGKAVALTFAFSCGQFQCAEGYVEQKVQLRGGQK